MNYKDAKNGEVISKEKTTSLSSNLSGLKTMVSVSSVIVYLPFHVYYYCTLLTKYIKLLVLMVYPISFTCFVTHIFLKYSCINLFLLISY